MENEPLTETEKKMTRIAKTVNLFAPGALQEKVFEILINEA